MLKKNKKLVLEYIIDYRWNIRQANHKLFQKNKPVEDSKQLFPLQYVRNSNTSRPDYLLPTAANNVIIILQIALAVPTTTFVTF